MGKIPLYLILNYLLFSIFGKIEETIYDIILESRGISQTIIGDKGTFGLTTNLSMSDPSIDYDIENQEFTSKIIIEDSENNYEVKCHFWKAKKSNLMILCQLQEDIIQSSISFKLDESIIDYKGSSIKIYTKDFIYIEKVVSFSTPFIYSDEQSFNLNDGRNSYEIKFKIEQFPYGVIIASQANKNIYKALECNVEGKELICKLEKEKIEGYLISDYEYFDIQCLFGNFGLYYCGIPGRLLLEYRIEKQTINIGIKNLLTNVINSKNYIAYGTNITSLSELSTDSFSLRFKNNYVGEEENKNCILKKNNKNDPLMILCETIQAEKGNLILSEIFEDLTLNYVSNKFTFVIKPAKIEENINVDSFGNLFHLVYPDILDYTIDNIYNIILVGDVAFWNYQNELYLFPNSTKLDCEYNNIIIKCSIPKSYFGGKENGEYYFYQISHAGEIIPIYELKPLKVILTGYSGTYIKVRLMNLIIILLIFILL